MAFRDFTYWPIVSKDQYDKPTFAARQTIKGHIEKDEVILRDDEGREFNSRARVYTRKIELQQGGWVLPRIWVDGQDDEDPQLIEEAYRIARVKESQANSLINASPFLYTAYLR